MDQLAGHNPNYPKNLRPNSLRGDINPGFFHASIKCRNKSNYILTLKKYFDWIEGVVQIWNDTFQIILRDLKNRKFFSQDLIGGLQVGMGKGARLVDHAYFSCFFLRGGPIFLSLNPLICYACLTPHFFLWGGTRFLARILEKACHTPSRFLLTFARRT